jgi:hypothetical protein
VLFRSCTSIRYYHFGHSRGDLIEVLSSLYNLSIFSLKASSHYHKGAGVTPRESSSISIWDLWPEINNLFEAWREGTFATATRGRSEASTPCSQPGTGGSKRKIRGGGYERCS